MMPALPRSRLAPWVLLAALAGCKTLPPPPLFVESNAGYHVPPHDMAQVIFLVPGALPAANDANALFELDGERRTLVAALAAHGKALLDVKPGHHVFMAYGRQAFLLEANVEAGARYYVLMRAVGRDGLQPLPMRMTDDAEISNRSPASGQWLMDTELVDMTPAAGAWFALRSARIATAQATAQAAWPRLSVAERAASTLQPDDAVLHEPGAGPQPPSPR